MKTYDLTLAITIVQIYSLRLMNFQLYVFSGTTHFRKRVDVIVLGESDVNIYIKRGNKTTSNQVISLDAAQRYQALIRQAKATSFPKIWSNINLMVVRSNINGAIIQRHLLFNPRYLLRLLFGYTLDYHSVFRQLAIRSIIKSATPTVDIGTGCGDMTIAVSLDLGAKVDAIVYESNQIAKFRSSIKKLGITYLTVLNGDAQDLKLIKDNYARQLLLIDVLEHVDNEVATIKSCKRVLMKGGNLIISVPTAYYPYYFGKEFDVDIGHKRHYLMSNLRPLLQQNGFTINDYFYYTSAIPSCFCKFLYNKRQLQIGNFRKMFFQPLLIVLGLYMEHANKIMRFHSSLILSCTKD